MPVKSNTEIRPANINGYDKTFGASVLAVVNAPGEALETIQQWEGFKNLGDEGKFDWGHRIARAVTATIHGAAAAVTYIHFFYKAIAYMKGFQAFTRWIAPITGIVVTTLELGYDIIQFRRLWRLQDTLAANWNPDKTNHDIDFFQMRQQYLVDKAAIRAKIKKERPDLAEKCNQAELEKLINETALSEAKIKRDKFETRLRPWLFKEFEKASNSIKPYETELRKLQDEKIAIMQKHPREYKIAGSRVYRQTKLIEKQMNQVGDQITKITNDFMPKISAQIKNTLIAHSVSGFANILTIASFVIPLCVGSGGIVPLVILGLTILGALVRLARTAFTSGRLDSPDQKIHLDKCFPDIIKSMAKSLYNLGKSMGVKVIDLHYYFQVNVYKTEVLPVMLDLSKKKIQPLKEKTI